MQDKLSLIIFVMRDNPLLDKLSGSLVGNSPTSNESANGRIQLHPKLGWKTSCQLDTKLKCRKQKNENPFDIICVEVESLGFMLVDRLATRQLRYFLKINFVPSWDEVLRCNLHQSKAWRFCIINSWWGVWNFISFDDTSGQFVQKYHQASIRKSKISLLQLSVKWKSVISCLFLNWE